MRVQTIYCDRCKKQIKEDPHQFYCEKIDSETGDIRAEIVFEEIRKFDFCGACAKEVVRVILQGPVPVMPPSEDVTEKVPDKKKSAGRTKIDWGKAIALKKASWCIKDIAEELHVSAAVLSQGFYRMNKTNKEKE